jgi:outer membrane immunogenic protein
MAIEMKRRALVAALLSLFATSSFAADMAVKAPQAPVAAPAPAWTGFYIGGNAGGTWGNDPVNTVSSPVADFLPGPSSYAANAAAGASGTSEGTGGTFIAGGQAGYNWQFSGSYLAGLEADFEGLGRENAGNLGTTVGPLAFFGNPDVITTNVITTPHVDYLGTVRGRLGYLATPSWLVYGTGGLAYGQVRGSTTINQSNNDCTFSPGTCITPATASFGSFSQTRTGWTAGGGFEWMFVRNLTARIEYLYYDLGSVTYGTGALVTTNGIFPGAIGPAVTTGQSTVRLNGNIVRFGLSYLFNG